MYHRCLGKIARKTSAVVNFSLTAGDHLFGYRLKDDPRFLKRIEAARASLRAGRGVRLEDVSTDE